MRSDHRSESGGGSRSAAVLHVVDRRELRKELVETGADPLDRFLLLLLEFLSPLAGVVDRVVNRHCWIL